MRICIVWCVFGSLASAAPPSLPDPDDAAYPAIGRFVQVMESVRKRHPDMDRLAYDRLVNHALEGMLGSLDPHSSFIHPEMAAKMKDNPELNPEIPSLGLTFAQRDDGPYVAAVAPQGSATEAGVLAGSALLEIEGKNTAGADLSDLLDSLRRPAGTVTKLLLKSPASPRPVEFSLTHRFIDERSIAESTMWDKEKKTGYVRLASFGNSCASEMEAALDELEDAGMKSLILDLRGNGGGSLAETVKILGLWLPPSTLVVTTRGRDESAIDAMKTPERQRRKREYPIVVLIDRMSASASELTAGALQDLKRATVIGEVSYGKGSVQNIIPMGGGTALRLTIATYHTPSGNTPHRKGITPDTAVAITELDRMNQQKRCRIASLTQEERKIVESWIDPVMKAAIQKLTS